MIVIEPSETTGLCEIWGTPAFGRNANGALDAGFVWMLLRRHARRPARFLGRALLRADNRAAAHPVKMPFWSEVQAYELFEGGFAVLVRHVRAEDDRAGFQDVWQADSGAAVIAKLRAHDVADCNPGGGPREHKAVVQRAWQDLLNALFDTDAGA